MLGSWRNPSQSSKNREQQRGGEEPWFAVSLKAENFVPGLLIGFLLGLFVDLSTARRANPSRLLGKEKQRLVSENGGEELKMVLIVRQDLKMGAGKIASQCAHAATGMYAELMQRNRLKEAADRVNLPTFVVADAGRTQVLAGSKTVLAIGPGRKSLVDSVAGKLRLL